MFRYIKPYKPHLNSQEYDKYKKLCAGFISYIRKEYGTNCRKLLKNNYNFLAVLQSALNDVSDYSDAGNYDVASACSVMILYHTLSQNPVQLNAGNEKFCSVKKMLITKPYKKACSNYPELAVQINQIFSGNISKLLLLDKSSEPSAKLMSVVASALTDDIKLKQKLNRFGYLVGRYIYILNAYKLVDKHFRTCAANPLIVGNSAVNDLDIDAINKKVNDSINFTLGSLSDIYVELEIHKLKPILDNIINISLKNDFYETQTLISTNKHNKIFSD